VALDVCLHVLRRHQPHLVPKRAELASPVVRRRTGFQPDHTPRNAAEERQHLPAPQSLAQSCRSFCIDPVHLKNVLRQVQSDRSNLVHGSLPFAADTIRQQFGTQMPQGGHPPHHSITLSARSNIPVGSSMPRALAVLRLTISSNLVACSTGRSAGLAPLRIFAT